MKRKPLWKRFVEKTIIAGRRNGLHLGEEKRDRVKAVKKKISELGTQFGFNLNEDTTHINFSEAELDGVPKDLIDSFDKVDTFTFYLFFFQFASLKIKMCTRLEISIVPRDLKGCMKVPQDFFTAIEFSIV